MAVASPQCCVPALGGTVPCPGPGDEARGVVAGPGGGAYWYWSPFGFVATPCTPDPPSMSSPPVPSRLKYLMLLNLPKVLSPQRPKPAVLIEANVL